MLAKRLKKYCDISNLPDVIGIAIWTIIILVLTGLLINDFVPLVHDYQYNNDGTKVTVIKTEKAPPPPSDMTICMPYYSYELDVILNELVKSSKSSNTITCNTTACNAMKDHSWDMWNQITFDKQAVIDAFDKPVSDFKDYVIPDYTDAAIKNEQIQINIANNVTTAILEKVLQNVSWLKWATENISRSDAPGNLPFGWIQPIIDTIWNYFKCKSMYDLSILMSVSNESAGKLPGFVYCENYINGIIRMNKSDTDFLYIIASRTIDEALFGKHTINPVLNLEDRNGVTIWQNKLCFTINLDKEFMYKGIPYPGSFYYNKPGYYYNNQRERVGKIASSFLLFEDSTSLYLDVEPKHALCESNAYSTLTLFYNLQSKVIETRNNTKCSQENTVAVCVAKKQLDEVIKTYHCIPFALRNLLVNLNMNDTIDLPYCDASTYSTDMEKFTQNAKIFWSECSNKCNYLFYNWKIKEQRTNWDTSHALGASVYIENKTVPYIEFALIDQFTFAQFLSQVGGIAGLYLGLSGLTVITLLIFLIDLCKRWLKLIKNQKSDREENSNAANAPSAFQSFQMKTFINLLQNAAKVGDKTACDHPDIDYKSKIDLLEEKFERHEKELAFLREEMIKMNKEMILKEI